MIATGTTRTAARSIPIERARTSLPEKTTAHPKDSPHLPPASCMMSPVPSTPDASSIAIVPRREVPRCRGIAPLRLESVADVDALSGQSREMRHRGLVLYAHENEPVKPQAVALLPKRIDLALRDVKKRFRRVVQAMELSEGILERVTFVDSLKASFGGAQAGGVHAPVTISNRRKRCSRESRHSSRG